MTTRSAGAAREQVETSLMRALAVLRAVVLVYAVALNALRWRDLDRLWMAVTVVVAMVVWSALVTWVYEDPSRRRTGWFAADLAVAVLALLSTPLAASSDQMERHASSVPTFWVVAAVLAVAIHAGAAAGGAAAAVVAIADISIRVQVTGTTIGNIFLMLLAGLMVGYLSTQLRASAELRAAADGRAAAAAERERLARVVHDGVLQVLAMVARRAGEPDSPVADLGRLAAEQEASLRALVQRGSAASSPTSVAGSTVDLAGAVGALSSPTVVVSTPATAVDVPAEVAAELLAAVGACLDNVRRHAGSGAGSWLLLETDTDAVVLSVRDDGAGVSADRLDEAEREGRLGITHSIRGRLADLGGRADLVSRPGEGVEWELRVPWHPADRSTTGSEQGRAGARARA